MPLKKQIIESDKIVHELIEDVNEIEVINPDSYHSCNRS